MRRSEEGISTLKPNSKKAKVKTPNLQSVCDKMNEVKKNVRKIIKIT